MALEQGFDSSANSTRGGQGQHMTRANEAAIGVRATSAELAPIDDRDPPTRFQQVMGTGRADHPAADDDNMLVHNQSSVISHQ